MQLPSPLQKLLDQHIPANKQEAFVADAIKKALAELPSETPKKAQKQKLLRVYTDGGARGNPGPGGCGAVIADDKDEILYEAHKFLGNCTNNQAEYQGMILALSLINDYFPTDALEIFSDSELMVKQLNGQYKVKNPDLQQLFLKAQKLLKGIPNVIIRHIPRNKNKRADALSNQAMDEGTKKKR